MPEKNVNAQHVKILMGRGNRNKKENLYHYNVCRDKYLIKNVNNFYR